MWQSGGVVFLALKMSQDPVDGVLLLDASDDFDRSAAADGGLVCGSRSGARRQAASTCLTVSVSCSWKAFWLAHAHARPRDEPVKTIPTCFVR